MRKPADIEIKIRFLDLQRFHRAQTTEEAARVTFALVPILWSKHHPETGIDHIRVHVADCRGILDQPLFYFCIVR